MIARTIVVVALALLWSAPPAAADAPQDREEHEEAAKALIQVRSWMVYQRGHLLIEGTVVDEDGKPIPEFVVEYPHARTEKDLAKLDKAVMKGGILGDGDAQAEISQTPDNVTGKDGRFRINAKYIDFFSGIWFTFRATDYYNTEVHMESLISDEESAVLDQVVSNSVMAKEWTPPKEVPSKKKFKVVMRKRGRVTKLDRWYLDLAVMQNGERLGYQFAPTSGKQKAGSVTLLPQTKTLPARAMLLSVKRSEKGEILVKKIVRGSYSDEVATDVKIVMNSASGDGFVRYEPHPEDKGNPDVQQYHKEPIRRSMAIAPETGYNSELSFSAEDLLSGGTIMLYFKCGGRYGRARYAFQQLEKDRSKFVLRLEVELQPDGSRNLETGE